MILVLWLAGYRLGLDLFSVLLNNVSYSNLHETFHSGCLCQNLTKLLAQVGTVLMEAFEALVFMDQGLLIPYS